MVIRGFFKEFRWLSNYQEVDIAYRGLTYKNTEAAYQASKSLDIPSRKIFTTLSGREARLLGQKLVFRPDWNEIKYQVMTEVNTEKYKEPTLRSKLTATLGCDLVEANYWHDNYWGQCVCSNCSNGLNMFGKILMTIRDNLN